jgi:hypothetical protein
MQGFIDNLVYLGLFYWCNSIKEAGERRYLLIICGIVNKKYNDK